MKSIAIAVLISLFLTSVGFAAAGTETYGYDALSRLTSVTFPDGTSTNYYYDAAGNRTSYTSPAVSTVTETTTMTQGTYTSGPVTFNGYYPPYAGSISPATLPSGKQLVKFYDQLTYGALTQDVFAVSGFTADPGQAWLVSATVNGQTRAGPGGTYSYAGGVAQWQFGAPAIFFSTGTAVVTIVHH